MPTDGFNSGETRPISWTTVCKTVHRVQSDTVVLSVSSLMSCLSVCLSMTLVYCGQTVGWIKMPLGMEVGFGPGHIVLDGDPVPPSKAAQLSQFSAHVCCGQTAGWIKMPLGREVNLGLDPGNTVLDGNPAPKKWHSNSPLFGLCLLWPNGWMD